MDDIVSSLKRGASSSPGCAEAAKKCTPCIHFTTKAGCRHAEACRFCHLEHAEERRATRGGRSGEAAVGFVVWSPRRLWWGRYRARIILDFCWDVCEVVHIISIVLFAGFLAVLMFDFFWSIQRVVVLCCAAFVGPYFGFTMVCASRFGHSHR